MKCQNCGKKEATVKYYENINGKKEEYHFCSECAKKYGIGISDFANFSDIFSPMFLNFPEFEKEEIVCDKCGYTLEDYSKTGMLGCPSCYDTFKDTLDDMLVRMHGKNRHIKLEENKSEKNSKEEKIKKLKEEIKNCIDKEDYEKAAKLRDEIKALEGEK